MKRETIKPFAVQLYQRYVRGESIERLAETFHIPVERVAIRIRAAERFLQQHSRQAG